MSDTSEDLDVTGPTTPAAVCRALSPPSPSSVKIKRFNHYDERNLSPAPSVMQPLLSLRIPTYDKDSQYRTVGGNSSPSPNSRRTPPSSPSSARIKRFRPYETRNISPASHEPTPIVGPIIENALPLRNYWSDEGYYGTPGNSEPSSVSSDSPNGGYTIEENEDDNSQRCIKELKRLIQEKLHLQSHELVRVLSIALFRASNADKKEALWKLVTARDEVKRLRIIGPPRSSFHLTDLQVPPYRSHPGQVPSIRESVPGATLHNPYNVHPHIPRLYGLPLPVYPPGYFMENISMLPGPTYYPSNK